MKSQTLGIAVALTMIGTAADAKPLEGVVRGVGSGLNKRVLVTPGTGFDGPTLCNGDMARRISRLTSFTVKVDGQWRVVDGKQDCFEASTYSVTKTLTGRPALVGILSQGSGSYLVTADDGSKHPLSDVPDGLKKMIGKKVILDLKPMENPALKEAASKVVTYSEMP